MCSLKMIQSDINLHPLSRWIRSKGLLYLRVMILPLQPQRELLTSAEVKARIIIHTMDYKNTHHAYSNNGEEFSHFAPAIDRLLKAII